MTKSNYSAELKKMGNTVGIENLESVDFYPPIVLEDDQSPDFGIEIDDKCHDIMKACKGWGTADKDLIAAIGNTLAEERHKISLRFPELYEGKSLRKLMVKESSGHYGTVLEFCALGPCVAECAMIKMACEGAGTNEEVLHSIICGRSNSEIDFLKKQFYKVYTEDLGGLVGKETGGDFRKMLVSCLQGAEESYDPDYHTDEKAQEDAEHLYEAGQGKFFGSDESKMFQIVALAPPKHLQSVNEIYADKYGYTIFKAMQKELGGKAEEAALFTCGLKLKPYETIAHLIKGACKGMGTKDLLLTTTIIRFQHIMGEVNAAHIELFGKSVHERVRHETKGNYRDLLITLMNKVFPEE